MPGDPDEGAAPSHKGSIPSSFIHSVHGPGPHLVDTSLDPHNDTFLVQLRQCMHCLQDCSWYKGRMSKRSAKEILRRCRPGSFLLRDSDNPAYLFSLSQNLHFVGPIATRIFFQDGLFWFDDGRKQVVQTPRPSASEASHANFSMTRTESSNSNSAGMANTSNMQQSLGFSCVVSLRTCFW